MASKNWRRLTRKWERERDAERERERRANLTQEEREAEDAEREAQRAVWRQEREEQEAKEAKLLEKYMKKANTITIEDFFKSEGPLKARVTAFCKIRGYDDNQTWLTVYEAQKLFRATRWRSHGYTREGAVRLMELFIQGLFILRNSK